MVLNEDEKQRERSRRFGGDTEVLKKQRVSRDRYTVSSLAIAASKIAVDPDTAKKRALKFGPPPTTTTNSNNITSHNNLDDAELQKRTLRKQRFSHTADTPNSPTADPTADPNADPSADASGTSPTSDIHSPRSDLLNHPQPSPSSTSSMSSTPLSNGVKV